MASLRRGVRHKILHLVQQIRQNVHYIISLANTGLVCFMSIFKRYSSELHTKLVFNLSKLRKFPVTNDNRVFTKGGSSCYLLASNSLIAVSREMLVKNEVVSKFRKFYCLC